MQVTVINKCARMLIRFYSFLCVFIWTMIFVLNAFIISSIDFRNVGFYRRLHQMQQYIFTFIIFVQHFFVKRIEICISAKNVPRRMCARCAHLIRSSNNYIFFCYFGMVRKFFGFLTIFDAFQRKTGVFWTAQ